MTNFTKYSKIINGDNMENLLNHEKHYITFNNYLKNRFGHKVFRISLNAGFTCPNRDGSKSNLGCIYCSEKLSGDFAGNKIDSFKVQFEEGLKLMNQKWEQGTYIAYLQAGTNTYSDINTLRNTYEEIISLHKDIEVLSIATRPDCINEEIVDLLDEINQKCEVWIELGFQTMHESTSILINKCYTNKDFEKAIKLLNDKNIKVIVHIINGLPNETKEMMIETTKYLNQFNLFGLKIHMLHIMKNTPLENIYQEKPFHILSLEEFVDITTTQLRYINTNTVIHRLTGDSPKELLIEPFWTLKKFVVLNEIDKHMRKYNIYQGDLC